jgi:molybdate transport system permease protein
MDWVALGVSLRLATATTVVLALAGLPLAHWLAFSRKRVKFVVEVLVALPLVLPPTVLGFYLLMLFGPRSALGTLLENCLGYPLPFSFTGLVVGSVIAGMPYAVRPFTVGFAGVSRRFVEASYCLGESSWGTFRRVTLPLAWPGILSGLIMAFAHTLGEFGVVLMIGGNIPGLTRTISIAIYDDVQALEYSRANHAALLLLVIAFLTMSITYTVQRRTWTV